MRRLLTGYAVTYNLRHSRHGHLFQNRYHSIVCDEDVYFQELVRYIHLNPLRATLVEDLSDLDRYPWRGHLVVKGKVAGDPRILGRKDFLERVLNESGESLLRRFNPMEQDKRMRDIVEEVCHKGKIEIEELRMGSRQGEISRIEKGTLFLKL